MLCIAQLLLGGSMVVAKLSRYSLILKAAMIPSPMTE